MDYIRVLFIVVKVLKGGGELKVQKVVVEEKPYPLYILLDKNFDVVEPVKMNSMMDVYMYFPEKMARH